MTCRISPVPRVHPRTGTGDQRLQGVWLNRGVDDVYRTWRRPQRSERTAVCSTHGQSRCLNFTTGARLIHDVIVYLKTGADVIGVNCNFGPKTSLRTIKLMKEALDEQNMNTPLMMQPLVFLTPEVESGDGFHHLPGHFLGLHQQCST